MRSYVLGGIPSDNMVRARATPVGPTNTVAPSISGTARSGETLTATKGTYTGTWPISLSGNWQRDSVDIAGATALTYTLVDADVGAMIRYREVATNKVESITTYSAAVGPVANALVTTAPTLTVGTVTHSSVPLTRDSVANAASYELEYSLDNFTTPVALHSNMPTSYTHENLDSSTTYYYRVRGVNLDGVAGPWSAVVSTTTAAWTPNDITSSTVSVWHESDTSAEFTFSSGSLVSQWTNKKGTPHLVQSTAAEQPTYVSGVAVDFDGTDDHLVGDTTPLILAEAGQAWEIAVAFSLSAGTVISQNIASGGADRQFQVYYDGTSLFVVLKGTHNNIGAYTADTDKVLLIRWDGTNAYAHYNGADVALTVGAAVAETGALFKVGARSNSTTTSEWNWGNGRVRDLLICTGSVLSATERTKLIDYLTP